jgi:hyaluronate lyase
MDGDKTVTATFDQALAEIIVDNDDPGCATVGSWGTGTWGSPWDGTQIYDRLRSTGSEATFTPDIPAAGSYEVFVWGVQCTRYCAPTAPFTVNHASGSDTILVDQGDTSLFGGWISLGEFTFDAGTSGSVVLSDDGANGRIIADAVRWVTR